MKSITEVHKTALKNLIKIGKKQGYLTYSEINDLLPEDMLTPEQVEPIVATLKELDIVIANKVPYVETVKGITVSKHFAINHGLQKYFTGEPCINGHIAERFIRKGNPCVECIRLQKKRRRERLNEIVEKTGKNTYFTGVPCINGHKAERYLLNNTCVTCHKLKKYKKRKIISR